MFKSLLARSWRASAVLAETVGTGASPSATVTAGARGAGAGMAAEATASARLASSASPAPNAAVHFPSPNPFPVASSAAVESLAAGVRRAAESQERFQHQVLDLTNRQAQSTHLAHSAFIIIGGTALLLASDHMYLSSNRVTRLTASVGLFVGGATICYGFFRAF